MIKTNSKIRRQETDKAIRDYRKHLNSISKRLSPNLQAFLKVSLHDKRIRQVLRKRRDVILSVGDYEITFYQCSSTNADSRLENQEWLYDEIECIDHDYEIRILLSDERHDVFFIFHEIYCYDNYNMCWMGGAPPSHLSKGNDVH